MGNSPIEDAMFAMKLDSSSKVLVIGSGFGGPARMLSTLSNCATVALELQSDIHVLAENLTRRCNLTTSVTHISGDILDCNLEKLGGESFDGIVSFLVFLHIPDKKSLLEACAKMLKSGGTLFVEDFYCRSPFSVSEVNILSRDIFCEDLPTREEYLYHLEASGFHNIQFIDKSSEWT